MNDHGSRPLDIAIVGGGLGGLASALFLNAVGHRPIVYEAVPELKETGAGIVVPPNMVRCLAPLGLSQSLKQASACLDAAWEFRRWQDGQILFSQPMGERCKKMYGAHCYVAHRADLMTALVNELPEDQLKLDHRCIGFKEIADKIELTVSNKGGPEQQILADVVIGADGIHSRTRDSIVPKRDARFSGLCAFRCLVPSAVAPPMALRAVQTLWLGPGRHFVHYPVRNRKLVNIVAIVPSGDWRAESWTDDGDVADLASEFQEWDPRLGEMIAAATDTKRWALYDHSPLERWTKGRATLLGDAAHAMLPFFAQGAAQAIEDGAVLADCLRKASPNTVANALQHYESIRKPRASEVQLMSRGREIRNHLPDGPQQQKRDRELANGDPLTQSAWLYGHDVLQPRPKKP